MKLVALGGGITVAARYGFGRDWKTALLWGLAAVAAVAVLTAQSQSTP